MLNVLFFLLSAFADDLSINCSAVAVGGADVYVSLQQIKTENGVTKARFYSGTILVPGESEFAPMAVVDGGSFDGENLVADKYDGRKYKNHLRFNLLAQNTAGFRPESAYVIVSPEYTVAKTVPQVNHWDKTWTWDVEVRKHSAVLDTHFNDHHGDYLALECYSLAHVNDSKHRP